MDSLTRWDVGPYALTTLHWQKVPSRQGMARSKTATRSLTYHHRRTNGFSRGAMTKPRPLYLAVRCCMSTNLCPDASSRLSLAATFVSWRHVKSRWYLAPSLPSRCRFSAAFSPHTFHMAREMVKLLLSCSVRGLGWRKVDIIKGASHGSPAIYQGTSYQSIHEHHWALKTRDLGSSALAEFFSNHRMDLSKAMVFNTQPYPDPLHAGVLAHRAPPVPTQQGEGHFAKTLCYTTGLTMHPSGVIPLLCCYHY